jgi:hypothetical protein
MKTLQKMKDIKEKVLDKYPPFCPHHSLKQNQTAYCFHKKHHESLQGIEMKKGLWLDTNRQSHLQNGELRLCRKIWQIRYTEQETSLSGV